MVVQSSMRYESKIYKGVVVLFKEMNRSYSEIVKGILKVSSFCKFGLQVRLVLVHSLFTKVDY